ncbi:MAG: MFS transporter [Chloroflexi bacterium]|nr:MFS transporter [Chloroflexota bacterium]
MESRNPYQSPEYEPSESDARIARTRRVSHFAGPLLSLSALSFVSAGLVSSATFVPRAQRWQWGLVIASVIVGVILLALSFNMPLALAAAAGMGASQAGFMTITHTMIQTIVPDGIRGRVAGIYSMHVGGMMASVNLINGGLADYINAPVLLAVGGVMFIVVMFLSLQRVTIRNIYSQGLGQDAYAVAD